MPLTLKDRKILWARSGNHCAFPGCSQALVERGSGRAMNVVVGEEAHIVARRPEGPRAGGSEGSDTYENMLLLCPTHHRIIDEQPDVFSVETLMTLKAAHESRVREWALHGVQRAELDPNEYLTHCRGNLAWNAWKLGNGVVVACGYGSTPASGPNSRRRGSGIAFLHIVNEEFRDQIFNSSEAEPDIEYWTEAGSLHIVQYTVEPDANLFMPLVEHVFEFEGAAAVRHTTRALIRAHPPHDVSASDLAGDLRQLTRDAPSGTAQLLLYRLRNAGWTNPAEAIALIEDLRNLWWYDGANAEAASSIRRELELVRDASR